MTEERPRPVWITRPPKRVSDMTDAERRQYAQTLADRIMEAEDLPRSKQARESD